MYGDECLFRVSGEDDMRIIKGIFAVLVPGAGKLLRKKYISAAFVIVLWTALAQAYVLLKAINPSGLAVYVHPALLAALVSIFAANAVLESLHLARDGRAAQDERLDEVYSQALTAFLSGEHSKADELLKTALRIHNLDPDSLFLRGQVAAALGKKRRARRFLRKCRDFDEEGKWKWEIASAIERL